MEETAIDRAAVLLSCGRLTGTAIAPLPDDCRPPDEDAGYAVQARLNGLLREAGLGDVAGFKIGCTTPVMQAYVGIGQPCAGEVFETTVHTGVGRFAADAHRRLGVECELAVRLGAPLPASAAPFDRDGVAAAVVAVMPSIEPVEDRYVDWRNLDAPTLIADDFFNAGVVLGPEDEDWRNRDLVGMTGRMAINGDTVGEGRGGDIMGHPLDALAWLANRWASLGRDLPAGAFVSLGSLVETVWLNPGDRVEIALDGLGGAGLILE